MHTARWALFVALALILVACGGTTDESVDTGSPGTSVEATTTTEPAVAETTTPTLAASLPLTFTGADGIVSDISDTSRIVSLNGDLTEIIFELGAGANVVAIDVTTTYPAEAAELPVVGFGQQLAPEPVLAFEPTLVLADTQVGPPEALQQLRDAGVPVVVLEYQSTLEGIETKIMQVAEVLGLPDEGADLAAQVDEEIEAARARAAEASETKKVAFIYTRGPELALLFGAGMPTSAMIEAAGGIDVAAATGIFGAAPVTPEALVAAAPDVIVLPAAGLAALGGNEALLELPGVAETPAGQTGSFLAYDEAYFFNFGPRVGQALDQFVSDLHPELAGGA